MEVTLSGGRRHIRQCACGNVHAHIQNNTAATSPAKSPAVWLAVQAMQTSSTAVTVASSQYYRLWIQMQSSLQTTETFLVNLFTLEWLVAISSMLSPMLVDFTWQFSMETLFCC